MASNTVVHKTLGLLDIRAVTTFGLNTKPATTNPIGHFGTGFKYAIAVLARHGIDVQIFIGTTEFYFDSVDSEFRDKTFKIVRMRRRTGFLAKWDVKELAFTTELGKNWKLWQAYRELASNTIDEMGTTFIEDDPSAQYAAPNPRHTTIYINSQEYADVHRDRDKIFLPDGLTERAGDATIQVMQAPSNYLYFRGLRVLDLEKPSLLTYNVLSEVELTEDRTVKSEWEIQHRITAFLSKSKDPALIHHLLNAKEEHWESTLPFDTNWETPSQEFLDILRKRNAKTAYTSVPLTGAYLPRFTSMLSRYEPPPLPIDAEKKYYNRLKVWIDNGEIAGYPDLVKLLSELIPVLEEKDL